MKLDIMLCSDMPFCPASELQQAERGKDGADKDDEQRNGGDVANANAIQPLVSKPGGNADFLHESIDSGRLDNQETGGKGSDRHHDSIGEKIKEIQKLHADDRDGAQNIVAEGGERAEREDDAAHQEARGAALAF